MDAEQKKIVDFIRQYRPDSTLNIKKLKAYLSDCIPDNKLLKKILCDAYEEEVHLILSSASDSTLAMHKCKKRLEDDCGMESKHAAWAVETWACILGHDGWKCDVNNTSTVSSKPATTLNSGMTQTSTTNTPTTGSGYVYHTSSPSKGNTPNIGINYWNANTPKKPTNPGIQQPVDYEPAVTEGVSVGSGSGSNSYNYHTSSPNSSSSHSGSYYGGYRPSYSSYSSDDDEEERHKESWLTFDDEMALEDAGLDVEELAQMDWSDRSDAIEEAGLDSSDFDYGFED